MKTSLPISSDSVSVCRLTGHGLCDYLLTYNAGCSPFATTRICVSSCKVSISETWLVEVLIAAHKMGARSPCVESGYIYRSEYMRQAHLKATQARLQSQGSTHSKYNSQTTLRLQTLVDSKLRDLKDQYWSSSLQGVALAFLLDLAGLIVTSSPSRSRYELPSTPEDILVGYLTTVILMQSLTDHG